MAKFARLPASSAPQITPLSPKWRQAIEQRIAEERQLTILAVSKGARAHPGTFWNLPGTFLFNVYVMTALGFGAPVPHTVWGRSSALIYAFVAVPGHIYLMVNASTCLIINLEGFCCRKRRFQKEESMILVKRIQQTTQDFLRLPCACRCVPLASLTYYGCGAIAFGVLRDLPAIDILMFPLEFTTTGGLEHVVGYVRILYGIYVEGAMVLLSSGIATFKRHSSVRVNSLAESYKLFQVEPH